MARWGFTAATTLLAAVALGVGGCGPAGSTTAGGSGSTTTASGTVEVVAGLGPEGQALAALGLDPADLDVDLVAAPAPSTTGTAGPQGTAAPERAGDRPRGERADQRRTMGRARVLLRRGALHGEAVVRTRDGGTRTVVVQRGEVTAVDGDSMTVRSTDGFTLTWTFADDLRVVERRRAVQPEQVKVGTKVAVAGAKDGSASVARLVVIPRAR